MASCCIQRASSCSPFLTRGLWRRVIPLVDSAYSRLVILRAASLAARRISADPLARCSCCNRTATYSCLYSCPASSTSNRWSAFTSPNLCTVLEGQRISTLAFRSVPSPKCAVRSLLDAYPTESVTHRVCVPLADLQLTCAPIADRSLCFPLSATATDASVDSGSTTIQSGRQSSSPPRPAFRPDQNPQTPPRDGPAAPQTLSPPSPKHL